MKSVRPPEVMWKNTTSTWSGFVHDLMPGRTGRVRPTEPGAYSDRLAAMGELIDPNGPGGCWIWSGPTNPDGYGPHRTVYEVLVGAVHRGWVLHHTCQVKVCCNPKHLEAMPNSEHVKLHAALR